MEPLLDMIPVSADELAEMDRRSIDVWVAAYLLQAGASSQTHWWTPADVPAREVHLIERTLFTGGSCTCEEGTHG